MESGLRYKVEEFKRVNQELRLLSQKEIEFEELEEKYNVQVLLLKEKDTDI